MPDKELADYALALCNDTVSEGASCIVAVVQNGKLCFYRVGSDDECQRMAIAIMSNERAIERANRGLDILATLNRNI